MTPPMPVAESVVMSYTVLAAGASATVATLAAATPGAEDAWAVIGAMLAGGISVVHAMRSQRSTLDLGCVLVAAAFCGSVIPGVVVSIYFPDAAYKLTWHGWSAAGFVSGLAGWSLTRGLISFFESINWIKTFRKRTGLDDDEKKP